MSPCAMCCANVRVFCFDEGAIYEDACDSGRDPVLISQQEMRFDEVEMWCYVMSMQPSTLISAVLSNKHGVLENEVN